MSEVNKIKPISEAVAAVWDGAHVFLSGFTIARNAIAIAHELIRQNKRPDFFSMHWSNGCGSLSRGRSS